MRQFYLLFLSISFAFFGFLFRNNPSDSAAVNYEKKFLAKQKLNPPKKYRPLVLKPEKIEVNSSEKSAQIWVDNTLFVPNITATKSVVVNGGGNPVPGSQLDYTVSLSNTGTDATGVVFTDILNSNLTLVPGSVKASPIAVDDSYDCIGNVGINVPVGSGLLANDINPVVSSMTVTSVNTAGTQGTVSHNPDGSFTFVPNVGFSGTTTFTYDVSNTHFTRTGTVTITVSAPIWFVNIAGGSGGTGTISSPFQNWSDFAAANVGGAGKPDNNHVIFIYSGSYSGAATLRSGQKVLGAGATVSLASFAGITVPTHSFPALPSTSGTRPILTSAASTITLPSTGAISLRGFDMENSATDIASGATFGTLTTSEMTLNGTGRALLLNTGTLAATFNSITSTNSATNGISLAAIAGTLTVTGGTTITNPTTEGILLISSTSVTSLNANFGNTNITGSGGSGILTTGTTSNTATLTFGDLDIAPDAGVGAMNVWAANTITCTSGTITTSNTGGSVPGIYLEGASSAAKANLNMVLDSYTTTGASGALHGLTLKNTSGSFTINGTGSTAGSGGSISGFRDRGANFENASNITLKNMNFTNANSLNDGTVSASDNSGANGAIHANTVTGLTLDNIAISGTTVHNGINLYKVTNFSLANSSLASCGNNAGTSPTLEGGIHAIDLAGTCTINNVNISSPTSRGLLITQLANATPLVFNISGLTVTDTYNSANGNDGVEINCNNSTVSTLNISGSTILRSKTNGVQGLANNSSALTVNIQTSTISNGGSLTGTDGNPGGAIELSSNNNASLKFNILNNVGIKANGIAAVYIGAKINGTAEGRINDNPNIRTVGTCCGAIWADVDNGTSPNNGNMKIEILRNTLSTPNSFDQGIYLRNANGAGRLDATINNNNISTSNSNSFAGIWASAGTGTGTETNITCANMNTNAITNIAAGTALFADEAGSGTTLQLQRNSGSGTTAATIWPANGNTPSSVASGGNNIIVASLACLTPSNPLPSARIAFTEENARTSENTAVISEEKKETEIETEENVIEETEYISETKETLKVEEIALEKSVASPQSGETVTVNGTGSGFTLPAGKSTTITFSATVSATPSTCAITNVATVSGSNFTNVTTTPNPLTTNLIVPPPTGVTTATQICNGNSIGLVATCSSGTVQWYNTASTGTLLGTTVSLGTFTQSPTGNTTYQAACLVGGCESARTNSGLITVNPLPVPNPLSNSTVCSGNSLNLSSASSTSYSWTGPNSFTSSLRNPTISNVTTAAAGTYSITQTNSFGCTASATTSVSVNQTPTASVGSNSPICSGNTLNLTSNGGGTYSWTGPNSFTSSLQNPSINSATTAATGTYIVTVTSNGCTATNSVVVTVNANPTASPSSNSPQCEGSTLNLSSTSASTYAWSGPNSFSSSIQNPTISNVTTAATGTYTLTVSNVSGCTASATTTITINAKPVPNPSSNSPLNVGGTLNLSSNGGGTYAWAGPNSFSSSSQNPSISNVTTAASGTYTVTVTTSGCSATATTAVVVNEAYASSNSPICSGATLNLSAGGGVSYSWSGPNSFTSSAQNPSFSNATNALNGVYTVLVTASGGGTATATTSVTVNALPVPNPSSDSPKCVGSTLTFGSAAGMTSYSWAGPNSFSSSVQAPTISNISTAANGTYSLTVINANGCSASATTAVIINTLPAPAIGSNTPICSEQTLNLTSSGGNSYTWNGPNSFSSSLQNPTINNTTTAASGTYTLTVTNVEGCSATVTTLVTINQTPNPNAGSNSPICAGNTLNLTSNGGGTYTWVGPNSYSSTAQNPSITGATTASSGTYTFTVTNLGCSASATTAVTVTNVAAPTGVSINNTNICSGTNIVLTATCSGIVPSKPISVPNIKAGEDPTLLQSYNSQFASTVQLLWYDAATGGNLVGSGNSLTQTPNSTITYYAACSENGCESQRVATSQVFVTQTPSSPSISTNALMIQENSGSTLTDYQVRVEIDTQTPIALGQMQNDGDDLRFFDGSTPINYWIESGINTPNTVVWLKIPSLTANGNKTITFQYNNPSATRASAIDGVFEGPHSSTDSVASGGAGGVGNSQRGFRFAPKQDLLVKSFGKREPNGTQRIVTLFNYSTQAIERQHSVSGPAAQYSYSDLTNPIWLTNGTQYILTLFQGASDGYYFGTSSQIGQHLTYGDMRYCNSCTQNTFPTSVLSNYQYGYPDFWYYTKKTVNNPPTYSVLSGSNVNCGNTASLIASCSTGNVVWYNQATGGTQIGTGNTFTSAPLYSNNSFYAQCESGGSPNCVSNRTQTNVLVNTGLSNPTVTPPTAICSGNAITLSATCTTGNVTWYVSQTGGTGTTGNTFTTPNLSIATSYYVSCELNSCSSSRAQIDVTVNPNPSITLSNNSPVCVGNTLNLSSTESTSYLWSGPNSFSSTEQNPSIANVTTTANGTYTITQTNSFGCTASATTSVTVNALPVPLPTSNSPKCVGTTLSLSSAAGMSSYAWSGPNSFNSSTQNPSINNVTTAANGVYTLTVSNASGCSASATTSVIINTLPVPNPTSNSPICAGETVSLSSVAGMSVYNWSGPNSFSSSLQNPTISNATTAAGGTYTILVTDANGCSASSSVNFIVNPVPETNLTSNSPVCVGGTISLSSAVSFRNSWSGPNGFKSNLDNPSISNVTTAEGGVYTVTKENLFGCTATATINVVVNPAPTPTAGSNSPVCSGLTLNLTADGGTNYAWNGPNSFSSTQQNPNISNVSTAATGTYTVSVTNAEGCSATATTSVTINASPTPTATNNSPICVGTSLSLSASSANSYVWSGPNSFNSTLQNPNISNATLAANGTYTLTVTNVNGCTGSTTTLVTVNSLPIPTANSNSPVCVANTLTLSSGGGTNYSWAGPNSFTSTSQNPSISNVSTLAQGTYTVTVSDGKCSATATTAVIVNTLPTVVASSNTPICVGNVINLSAPAGLISYTWSGPNSFASTVQNPSISSASLSNAGTYTVTVTNVNGCSASATTSVVVNPIPTPVIGNNSPICEGSTLNLTSNSATTYSWSGPNSFTSTSQNPSVSGVGVLANGIYSVVHTNSFGCSASATTQVTVNPNPVVGATASMSAICVGNSVSLSANCTSYSVIANLTGGQQVPAITTNGTGTSIGTYNSITNQLTLATSFANLGTSATMAHIHSGATGVNGGVLVMFSGVPSATSGNFGYSGNVSSFASDLLAGNTYINIHTTANSGGEIRGQLSAVCTSNNYVWSPGNLSGQTITISPTTTTVYTVTASNSSTGCSATATTSVNVNALPIPSVGSNSPLCSGLTLNLTSSGGSTYAWTGPNSFASTAQNPSISNATTSNSGVYSVTITNINGCTATATASVTVFTLPNPNIGSNSPLCEGATLSLNAENGGTSYVWSGPNSFNSTLQNPTIGTTTLANAGVYSITITNSSGCTATATTVVVINPLNVSATNTGPYTTNQTIQLVGSGGNIYSWTGPNGFTATGAIVNRANATTNMAGVYTATITNGPCSNTATTNVVVTGIDPCVQLLEYTYVQAGNPYQPLFSLSNGMNIAQSPNPTSVIVHPICSTVTIESVEMNLQGPDGMNWNILQNVEPFALFDNAGLNVFGRTLVPGNYTLTVTGYSQDNKGGVVTYPKTEVRFTITGNLATVGMPTYSGTEFCAGSTVPVSFTTTGTFNSGNIFKVQLSDGNGDFTSPIEIGSSTTAGSINCLIPLSIPFGENYRMRVVSTDATSQNMNPSAIVVHPYIANLVTPTDDLSVDKTRKAVYQLNAANKVNSPAKVNYRAGNSIQLNAGFEAKAGTVFEAKIAGCN